MRKLTRKRGQFLVPCFHRIFGTGSQLLKKVPVFKENSANQTCWIEDLWSEFCFMHHFTSWTWIISGFNRAGFIRVWQSETSKTWPKSWMSNHRTSKIVVVSVVRSILTGENLFFAETFSEFLDVNCAQKLRKCQICVIYENLHWVAENLTLNRFAFAVFRCERVLLLQVCFTFAVIWCERALLLQCVFHLRCRSMWTDLTAAGVL